MEMEMEMEGGHVWGFPVRCKNFRRERKDSINVGETSCCTTPLQT